MHKRYVWPVVGAVMIGAFLVGSCFQARVDAADPAEGGSENAADRAIAAGEYVLAKQLELPSRDAYLAQITTEQSLSGDTVGAVTTMRQIQSAGHRSSLTGGAGQPFVGAHANGGGAFADFDSLMNLIQTTVVPDTWEALGGNSTMAPYAQGVYVDAEGTVKASAVPLSEGALENLNSLLSRDDVVIGNEWRGSSKLRCVSLRRVCDEIWTRRFSGQPLGDELLNLAGLSTIRYVIFQDNDIVLAGPVGGIDQDQGWYVDRETGRVPLRSDFLARCFSAVRSGTPFGCTIDPSQQGLAKAAQVTAQIQSGAVPIGKSAESLRDALGMQRIEVFGAAADTGVGLLMVEADRHMKQLALGEAEMPEGVDNYLDAVDDFIAQGPPNGLLLRLWFTTQAQTVRCDAAKRVFEIAGTPIRLSGENQRALADGQRGAVEVDPRSQQFVQGFNQNWSSIRDAYPIYGALESLYRAAAVAQVVETHASASSHRSIANCLAEEDASRDWLLVAPTQVASIATMHTVRRAGKRHHVVLASGGVLVEPKLMVSTKMEVYPSLRQQQDVRKWAPSALNHWWWDVK